MKSLLAAACFLLCLAQAGAAPPRVLLRFDDLGMSHAVNQSARLVAEAGFPVSASVMFACPWYQEAVEILKQHPQVAVGVHLALNSEWKNYRWGPVSGPSLVPSLVDENGFFWPNHSSFDSHPINLKDVERELRAQLERALRSGIAIDYMDHHMGTAVGTLELRELFERLAKEYKLPVPRYFGERYTTLFAEDIKKKTKALVKAAGDMQDDSLNLVVIHTGLETPEMDALVDTDSALMRGPKGESLVSRHRHAELKALLSKDFHKALKRRGAVLLTYRDLARAPGVAAMKRPELPPSKP